MGRELIVTLLVGTTTLVGCGGESGPPTRGKSDWDVFGKTWRAAAPDERREMANVQQFHDAFGGATRNRVRQIFGKADFEGVEYGTDTMRYQLGSVDGIPMSVMFQFENGKVSAVLGNFINEQTIYPGKYFLTLVVCVSC